MQTLKFYSSLFMGVLYIVAGVSHFRWPRFYLKIVPPYLPFRMELVYLSGLAEIILGMGLLSSQTRPFAAWGIILLLIAVFPANVYMYGQGSSQFKISKKVLFFRLPFQLVLIAWAYWYT